MQRRSLLLLSLFFAGALATYGYISLTHEPVGSSGSSHKLAVTRPSPRAATPREAAEVAHTEPTARSLPSAQTTSAAAPTPPPDRTAASRASGEDRVGQWIAETSSSDPRVRADAIVALSGAPRSRAIPALANVVSTADSIDAPLAMDSLKKLAMNQGDADEQIRRVVRNAIYHGTDDSLATVAQTTLSDIEVDLSRADAGARR